MAAADRQNQNWPGRFSRLTPGSRASKGSRKMKNGSSGRKYRALPPYNIRQPGVGGGQIQRECHADEGVE